jgi:Met-zincin/Domain of unknown function (DUF5117)
MNRILISSLALVSLAVLAQAPTPDTPPPPAAPPAAPVVTTTTPASPPGAPAATAPAAGQPRPFREVVKDAKEFPGLFPVWTKDEKVWIEIKPEQFNTPWYLQINRSRGLGEGFIYPFMSRGYLVEFRKIGGLVQLIAKNRRFVAQDDTPLARAIEQSFTDSLLAAAPVASAAHPEKKSILIEANALLLADIPGAATELETAFRVPYAFDARNSSIPNVRATEDMVNFEISAHYSIPKLPAPPVTPVPPAQRPKFPETLEDVRSLFLGYYYSIAKLPAEPMRARMGDDRIGHFVTRRHEFTNDIAPFPRQYMVNRWRLEKKDAAAALSEPKQPIVFWIDRNVPLEYRDTVRDGILEWNKAFERIGFRDAIKVEVQPNDADFDTNDARHASVRWYLDTSDGALAIGPRRVDPRTGEILDADIVVSQGWTRLPRRRIAEQLPPVASGMGHEDALCSYGHYASEEAAFSLSLLEMRGDLDPAGPEAEAIVKANLKDVITHEVGHTLGLRHNFRASTIYTEAQLRDPAFTKVNGLGGSVMDYNAWNLPLAKEKMGEFAMSTIGPYDYWAIEYAYKPIDAAGEAQELARIAARSNEPYLAFATDEEAGNGAEVMDPDVNLRDLGADPLAFAKRRMILSKELWDRLQVRTLKPGDARDILFRNVDVGFAQYELASEVAAKYVGGVTYVRDHAGSSRASFTPVTAARQREALKLLTDGLFRVDSFRFRPEFLARLAGDPFEKGGGSPVDYSVPARVLKVQTTVLDRLTSDAVAARLIDSGVKTGEAAKSLTLSEVYDALQAAIWSDLAGTGDIGLMRRNLQREHVKRLTLVLTRGTGTSPADARSLQRENARELVGRLRTAQSRPGLSKEARAHLSDSMNALEEALKAPMQRAGA